MNEIKKQNDSQELKLITNMKKGCSPIHCKKILGPFLVPLFSEKYNAKCWANILKQRSKLNNCEFEFNTMVC